MMPFRELAQAPHRHIAPLSSHHDRPNEAASEKHERKRNRHTQEQWDRHRDAIVQTYVSHPLAATIRIMKETCGFEASARMYKNKLKEWGVEKNHPQNVMQFVHQKLEQRACEGKNSVFFFKGIRLDAEAIRRFHSRQQYPSQAASTSPLKGTPADIEYYTPYDTSIIGELHATPQVFTPMSKLSAFASWNYNALKACSLTSKILQYDSFVQRITLIEAISGGSATYAPERVKFRHWFNHDPETGRRCYLAWRQGQKDKENECSNVLHTHYRSLFSIMGNGRFRREDLLQNILWSTYDLTNNIHKVLNRHEDESVLVMDSHTNKSQHDMKPPTYCIMLQSEDCPTIAVQSVIRLLQHNKLVQRILCLSRSDMLRWMYTWKCLDDESARLLSDTARCLFGDSGLSCIHLRCLTVLVHFTIDGPSSSSILLRMTLGNPESIGGSNCTECDACPMVLDYISETGAMRLNAAVPTVDYDVGWTTIKDFKHRYELREQKFFSRWFPLAHSHQGVGAYAETRECYCDGAVHREGYKRHYIDMQIEDESRNERWCPEPDRPTGEDFFHPLPSHDHEHMWILNSDFLNDSSDEDTWDPQGERPLKVLYDFFQPNPSDDEAESQYVSEPHF